MKRRKSPREIASFIGEMAKKASYDLERFNNPKKARELIQTLKKAERAEFEEIKEITDSEEVKDQIQYVYEMTEEVQKDLEEEKYSEVISFLEKIIEIEKKLYEEMEEVQLDERYQIKQSPLGEGFEGKVYGTVDSEELVIKILKKNRNTEDIMEKEKKYYEIEKGLPDSINVAKIRKIGYYKDRPAILMDKAPGKKLHVKPNQDSSHSNQEWYAYWHKMNKVMAEQSNFRAQYKKLVDDLRRLRKHSLEVETKSDNFFYHPKKGFTILDIRKRKGGVKNVNLPDTLELLVNPQAVSEFGPQRITEEDREIVSRIYEIVMNEIGNPCVDSHRIERTVDAINRLIFGK